MTMPSGGALPPVPPSPTSADAAAPASAFSPPFRIGLGRPGVFTDPRMQIAGGPSENIAPAAGTEPPSGTPSPTTKGPTPGNIGNGGAVTGQKTPFDDSNPANIDARIKQQLDQYRANGGQ